MRIAFQHLLDELTEAERVLRREPAMRDAFAHARNAIATLDELDHVEPRVFFVSAPRAVQQHHRSGRYSPRTSDTVPPVTTLPNSAEIRGIDVWQIRSLLDRLRADIECTERALPKHSKSQLEALRRFLRAAKTAAAVSKRIVYDAHVGKPAWIFEHARLINAIEKCAFAIAGTSTRF